MRSMSNSSMRTRRKTDLDSQVRTVLLGSQRTFQFRVFLKLLVKGFTLLGGVDLLRGFWPSVFESAAANWRVSSRGRSPQAGYATIAHVLTRLLAEVWRRYDGCNSCLGPHIIEKTFGGSFSAVSMPIFAMKYSLESA